MSQKSRPVLISGAGVAGLLLARSLKRANIPYEIYERDSTGSARSQGYRIRLSHQGLTAVSSILTQPEYAKFRKGCADNGTGAFMAYNAITMEPGEAPGGGGPPRGGGEVLGVDRAFVRNTLFEGIEAGVHFNKNATGYTLAPGGEGVTLHFSDGTSSPEGCLLVGADGVHSKLRGQLTDNKLKVYDTGARMIHGSSPRSAFDGLAQGRLGAFFLIDSDNSAGKIAMITNVREESGDDVHFGWVLIGGPGSFSAPNDDFSVMGQPAADISHELTKNWSSALRPIIETQVVPESAFIKMSTSDPAGVTEWTNEPRVTLLGDAVHAMTPAGGIGANTAMRDAGVLGRLLTERGGWDEQVTKNYEAEMRAYASQNVDDSFQAMKHFFGIKELNVTI